MGDVEARVTHRSWKRGGLEPEHRMTGVWPLSDGTDCSISDVARKRSNGDAVESASSGRYGGARRR
jgi:hypothetical protein